MSHLNEARWAVGGLFQTPGSPTDPVFSQKYPSCLAAVPFAQHRLRLTAERRCFTPADHTSHLELRPKRLERAFHTGGRSAWGRTRQMW